MRNIFKFASLLSAAVMLFACERIPSGNEGNEDNGLNGGNGGETKELRIVCDRDVIQANGEDASTLRVMLGDEDVTSQSEIFDEAENLLSLVDGKFTATEVGEYRFYANYGTLTTFNKAADDKGLLLIKAINLPVPAVVEDPDSSNLSFVHRAFLTQYTGTGCGYCPYMIYQLRQLMNDQDKTIPNKAVLAAAHSGYNQADPAAINAPQAPGGSYPFLQVDLVNGYTHNTGINTLYALINNSVASPAAAGISVSPKCYESEGTLVVKVAVKAAVSGVFNVGAWLLEDDIYGQQTDYDNVGDASYDTHENCVRIADSSYKGTFFGHLLGELSAGEVAEKTFVMNLKSKWKVENMHLAVFVSQGVQQGSRISYSVCNAVDVPIDSPSPFEYVK